MSVLEAPPNRATTAATAEAVTNGKLWETRFSGFDMYLCSPASKSTPNQCRRRTGGWSAQKSSLNGSPAALANDHGASNLHQRWTHLTPSARRGPGPDGPELTSEGIRTGSLQQGQGLALLTAPLWCRKLQLTGVDWCGVMACRLEKAGDSDFRKAKVRYFLHS